MVNDEGTQSVASSLFITGASGFIGRHLLARINPEQYDPVYCLTRSESTARKLAQPKHFHWLIGSIFDSDVYGSCLESSDMVIHLAATTGKARPDEYFRMNATGTQYLVEQCKQRGVNNFLYVSTIAVKYSNKANYSYAQSKQRAEEAVKQSGLNYAIVRPTIVLGKESPGWNALSKLARLPLIVVFGDGAARIQPIDVEDLVDMLVSIIEERIFFNESLDVGGPDIISVEEFLKKLHRLYYRKEPRTVHMSVKLLVKLIGFAERYLPALTPINAGQLSVFIQDSTITSNPLLEKRRSSMKGLDSLLRALAVK